MRYLENKIGSAGMQSLMASLAGGASFDAALNITSGASIADNTTLQENLMAGTVFKDFVSGSINTGNLDLDNGVLSGLDALGEISSKETITGASSGKTTLFQIGTDANQTLNLIVTGFSSDNLGLAGIDPHNMQRLL